MFPLLLSKPWMLFVEVIFNISCTRWLKVHRNTTSFCCALVSWGLMRCRRSPPAPVVSLMVCYGLKLKCPPIACVHMGALGWARITALLYSWWFMANCAIGKSCLVRRGGRNALWEGCILVFSSFLLCLLPACHEGSSCLPPGPFTSPLSASELADHGLKPPKL